MITKILIPPILIFALYVQFHGEYGPGGGFQAGVIFAAALILYTLIYGAHAIRQVINLAIVRMLAVGGVLLYGSTGLLGILSGHNFLDYHGFAADERTAQHIGIFAIELGVGLTVATIMLLLYFAFIDYIRVNRSKQ